MDAARTNARIEQARVEAARHRITQYEANLAKARHDLDKVTITAPMTGVITRLNVEEGENAIMGTLNNPGTVLLVIADLGTMEAWVEVDETEVVKVDLGQKADIRIDAFPGRAFVGTVTEIGNSPLRVRTGSSREAVDFEVKITLDGCRPNIRPGLSAKAEVTVAERRAGPGRAPGRGHRAGLAPEGRDIRRYNGQAGAQAGNRPGGTRLRARRATRSTDSAEADTDQAEESARRPRAYSCSRTATPSSCRWRSASPARTTSR